MAIPNTSAIAQQIMQSGNTYAPVDKDDKQNEWQKILAMLAMSNKMDAGTLAGFGLGKLLRDGFNSWKSRYDARDEIKGSLAGKSPEEQERQLKLMQEHNPQMYQNVMKYENQWRNPSTPQPTNNVNPAEVQSALSQYAQKLQTNPPATDWGGNGLSENANAYLEELLKERDKNLISVPFSRGW